MRIGYLLSMVGLLGLGACATQQAAPEARADRAPSWAIALESSADGFPEGKGHKVKSLIDEPELRLGLLTMKPGAYLPPHDAKMPVTIVALRGSGVMIVGEQRYPLNENEAVFLDAGVVHAVEASPDGELDLLIHRLLTY